MSAWPAVRATAALALIVTVLLSAGCTPLLRWRHAVAPDLVVVAHDGEARVPILSLPWHAGGPLWLIVGVKERRVPLLLFRTSRNELVATDARCPHDDCQLGLLEREEVILCPCDGSRFAADGRVLSGPAREPLLLHPVRIAGGDVVIRLDG